MISAKIIADSKNQYGDRITTFILTFPRIILAELNTHRMLSRNSASSRAIPFEKMLKMVQERPFIPMKWMKDHSGMQGVEYFEDDLYINTLTDNWLKARDEAVKQANYLSKSGLTKQLCNRLLEPFMYHTAIVTATEWENFFALRANYAAEIHLQQLAFLMLEAYNNSYTKQLAEGEWHIPFGDKLDLTRIYELIGSSEYVDMFRGRNDYFLVDNVKVMIATARCARVSYLNFEGKDDYMSDVKLFNQLSSAGHFSPFEHCAKEMSHDQYQLNSRSNSADGKTVFHEFGWSGNFKGFVQLRKTMEDENRKDERVLKNW